MILIIDDDVAIRTSLTLLLKTEGFWVKSAATSAEAMRILAEETPELILLDLNFSIETSGADGMLLFREIRGLHSLVPVIIITGWGTIDLAVEGMKLGASDFITKPWQNDYLLQSVETTLELHKQKITSRPETNLAGTSRRKLEQQFNFANIVGKDAKLLEILETVGRVASTNAPVLVTGESGTGKELIAEYCTRRKLA